MGISFLTFCEKGAECVVEKSTGVLPLFVLRGAEMSKAKFYLLSFTWGLPLTLVGLFVAAVLMIAGHKPKRWGYCWYFEIGENWGGVELGVVFLANKGASEHLKNHEHGHALQNCYFGFAMPFMVCIPSAVRYWYREIVMRVNPKKQLPDYDSIWFEGQATKIGTEFMGGEINGG